jgi:hypothetical protein
VKLGCSGLEDKTQSGAHGGDRNHQKVRDEQRVIVQRNSNRMKVQVRGEQRREAVVMSQIVANGPSVRRNRRREQMLLTSCIVATERTRSEMGSGGGGGRR